MGEDTCCDWGLNENQLERCRKHLEHFLTTFSIFALVLVSLNAHLLGCSFHNKLS